MDKQVRKAKLKLALFFTILSGLFTILTVLGILYFANSRIDSRARLILTNSLSNFTKEYTQGVVSEKEVQYQKSNIIPDSLRWNSRLPNVDDMTKEYFEDRKQVERDKLNTQLNQDTQEVDFSKLQELKDVYSRVILSNGDILYSSDLFELFPINFTSSGFRKETIDNVCIYSLTSKILDEEGESTTLQVASYCPITSLMSTRIIQMSVFITVVFFAITFVFGFFASGFLLKPVQDSIEKTKLFTRKCYHELMTPLTVAMTTAESSMRTKDFEKGVISLNEDLNSVYNSLNLLHKNNFDSNLDYYQAVIRLDEVLMQSIAFCKKKYQRDDLDFDLSGVKEVTQKISQTAFQLICNNLISNVMKYAKNNSKVVIILNTKKLEISNLIQRGVQIDMKNILKRTAESAKGTGLGLSIVKEIAEGLGWKISARLRNEYFCIEILFSK